MKECPVCDSTAVIWIKMKEGTSVLYCQPCDLLRLQLSDAQEEAITKNATASLRAALAKAETERDEARDALREILAGTCSSRVASIACRVLGETLPHWVKP